MFADRVGASLQGNQSRSRQRTRKGFSALEYSGRISVSRGLTFHGINQDIGVPEDIPQRPVNRSRITLLVLDLWTDGRDRYRYGHRAAALLVVVDFRSRRRPSTGVTNAP
jgi:hypothetical protein